MITLDEVQKEAERICAFGEDCDEATPHLAEDKLYEEVLRTIASGSLDERQMREMASAALRTKETEFPRWYE